MEISSGKKIRLEIHDNVVISCLLFMQRTLIYRVYHDHIREKSWYIDAEGHVGDDSLYHLTFALHITLNIDIFEELLKVHVIIW